MDRIDKLKFTRDVLKEIREIYRDGFNKDAHPHIWQDLSKIMSRVDVLFRLLDNKNKEG